MDKQMYKGKEFVGDRLIFLEESLSYLQNDMDRLKGYKGSDSTISEEIKNLEIEMSYMMTEMEDMSRVAFRNTPNSIQSSFGYEVEKIPSGKKKVVLRNAHDLKVYANINRAKDIKKGSLLDEGLAKKLKNIGLPTSQVELLGINLSTFDLQHSLDVGIKPFGDRFLNTEEENGTSVSTEADVIALKDAPQYRNTRKKVGYTSNSNQNVVSQASNPVAQRLPTNQRNLYKLAQF